MTINFNKPVSEQDTEALIEIMNLEGHNGDVQQFRQDAVQELRDRGEEPMVTGKDSDGFNVYGLKNK